MYTTNQLIYQQIQAYAPLFFTALCELEIWHELDSTNSYLLREKSTQTRAIIALNQTQGRGRLGKTWYAKQGEQLCVSLGFFVTKTPENFSALTLATGIGLADFFQDNYNINNIQLKWPNDLYIDNAKFGGILIETQFTSNGVHIVIGVGLNIHLNSDIIEKTQQKITSLDKYINTNINNKNIFFCELSAKIIQKIYQIFKQFEANGFGDFMSKFENYDYFLNKKIIQNKNPSLIGIGLGINQTGAYQIMDHQEKTILIESGEMGLLLQ